jgi:lysophospholipase L1-like esterase
MRLILLNRITCFVVIIISLSCFANKQQKSNDKILIDIGDSLTAGAGGEGTTMSSVTSSLLGEEWTVKNMGVGGENTLTIGARYGAIPMYIKESISIPKDGSKTEIPNGLFSNYNDLNIFPLLQGDAGINPCYIDSVKCQLTTIGARYFINRIDTQSSDYITKPKSTIITSLSEQTNGIVTIFIGQNGGYDTTEELLDQISLFVRHKGNDDVIIITSHGNGFPEIVQAIAAKYGEKVIDLKKYMSTIAISDAVKYGLLPDNGIYPTSEDLEKMASNNAPPSLLIDGIHFNPIGYELLGRLRYEIGKELGYW